MAAPVFSVTMTVFSAAMTVFRFACSVCLAAARAALTTFAFVALTVARVAGSSGLLAVPLGRIAGGGFAAACASIAGFTAPGRRCLGRARFAAVAAAIFAASTPSVAVAFVGNATALV